MPQQPLQYHKALMLAMHNLHGALCLPYLSTFALSSLTNITVSPPLQFCLPEYIVVMQQ